MGLGCAKLRGSVGLGCAKSRGASVEARASHLLCFVSLRSTAAEAYFDLHLAASEAEEQGTYFGALTLLDGVLTCQAISSARSDGSAKAS